MKKSTIATSLACVLFIPALVFGQAGSSAQIHGVITDAAAAVAPGAQIKAIQRETGQTRTTVSNADGSYVLADLPVGPYQVEVTEPGFETYVQSGVILQVGANVQLNAKLQVGSISQRLEVSADATMVDTQDTSVSQVIDQRRIVDLPLNGRLATDLIVCSLFATPAFKRG